MTGKQDAIHDFLHDLVITGRVSLFSELLAHITSSDLARECGIPLTRMDAIAAVKTADVSIEELEAIANNLSVDLRMILRIYLNEYLQLKPATPPRRRTLTWRPYFQ